jgi:hypothetical protein
MFRISAVVVTALHMRCTALHGVARRCTCCMRMYALCMHACLESSSSERCWGWGMAIDWCLMGGFRRGRAKVDAHAVYGLMASLTAASRARIQAAADVLATPANAARRDGTHQPARELPHLRDLAR